MLNLGTTAPYAGAASPASLAAVRTRFVKAVYQWMAGGLALTLFSQEAALPAAVSTMVMIGYTIWLDLKKRWD